jgi:hypothetical protein
VGPAAIDLSRTRHNTVGTPTPPSPLDDEGRVNLRKLVTFKIFKILKRQKMDKAHLRTFFSLYFLL